MKRILFIVAILCCYTLCFAQVEKQKVAVYVADDQCGLANYVTAAMATAMVHNKQYELIERTAEFRAQIDAEQTYQRTGMVDDAQIVRLGVQSGVPLICVISIQAVEKKYFMQARLLDMETAATKNITSPVIFELDEIEKAVKTMLKQLLSEGTESRSIQSAFE